MMQKFLHKFQHKPVRKVHKSHHHKLLFECFQLYLDLHAVPSYKEHLYKERLVDSLEYKEQRLVSFQIVKEHVFQVA